MFDILTELAIKRLSPIIKVIAIQVLLKTRKPLNQLLDLFSPAPSIPEITWFARAREGEESNGEKAFKDLELPK